MTKEDVMKLREETGAGVMDCKRALEDAGGDFSKAKKIIEDKGMVKAEKREGRETGAGRIEAYIHNGRVGVLLELRSETDFAAKSEPFVELAHDLALQLAAVPALSEEEFLGQAFIRDEARIVKDLMTEVIAKVGENIRLSKFYRIEL